MRIGPSKRFKLRRCPWCSRSLTANAAIGYDDTPLPVAGDISFCVYCGEMSIYTHNLGLRKPTEAETIEAAAMPEIKMIREVWTKMMESKQGEIKHVKKLG